MDVGAVFYIEATNFLTHGAGLVGFELHAQNLAGQAFHILNAFGHFHAAALAAPTGMDLGFHHPHRAAQFLRCFHSLLNGEGSDAARNWHTELAQDVLALVFMDFHGTRFLGSRYKQR